MPEPDSVEHNESALAKLVTDVALAGLAALAYFGTVDFRALREDTDD